MSDFRVLLCKHYSQKRNRDGKIGKRFERSISPDAVKSRKSKKRHSRSSSEEETGIFSRHDKKKSFDHNKNNQRSREVTLGQGENSEDLLISISGRNREDTARLPNSSVEDGKNENVKDENEHLQTKAKLKDALKKINEKDAEIEALQERVKSLETEIHGWKVCFEENAEKLRDATSQKNDIMSKNDENCVQQMSCLKTESVSIKKEGGVQEQGGLVATRKKLQASEKKRKEYKNACLQKKKSLQLKDQEISTLKSENRNLLKRLQSANIKSPKDVKGILTIDISD